METTRPRTVSTPEPRDCGGMKLYVYGSGRPVISFHGLNGQFNDSATIVYDIERGCGLDLTKFKVYALQLNPGDTDWSKNDISAVFNAVKCDGYTSVDITGVSLGGMAVIRSMCFNDDPNLTSWPRLEIKSCGIVCGKDDRKTYDRFAKIKIKAWHGTADPTMPYVGIQTLVNETKKLGGDCELLSLEGVTHNAWNYAYNNDYELNYYRWLTEQCQEPGPEPEPIPDPVKSFVVINDVGVIETESGAVFEIALIKK